MITFRELSELLREPPEVLRAWIADGLPWIPPNNRVKRFRASDCKFDPDAVATWLQDNGHYEPTDVGEDRTTPRIVDSTQEVAAYFGVQEQNVRLWRNKGMPWSDQGYDLEAIAEWRAINYPRQSIPGDTGTRAQYEAERSRIRAERERLELDKQLGRAIDVMTPTSIFTRHIAEVKAHLSQLPEYSLTLVPANLPAEVRKELRDGLAAKIREYCEILAHGLDEWANAIGREDD